MNLKLQNKYFLDNCAALFTLANIINIRIFNFFNLLFHSIFGYLLYRKNLKPPIFRKMLKWF